ncbi:MAG: CocE/NonD family hydrolase [Candidatus Aminicenantes bacterium]|nr:MAG: CocE/NonD family hydrolase [Candidatus Aminicenantes bacterium]
MLKKIFPLALILIGVIAISYVSAARRDETSVNADVKLILDEKIPMRDGVKLSARIWMPEKMAEPLPTVFVFTPYISDESQERGMFFARRGYVYISTDTRGRGNSQGMSYPLEGDKHSKDIYDMVTWIAKQPWSDSRVVMRGGSYRGMVQWQAMKTRPQNLVSIVPTASAYPGLDFPSSLNIFYLYTARWLASTNGLTDNASLFGDNNYWKDKYLKQYREHLPYSQFWKLAGIEERIFKRWLAHPYFDEFWQSCSPTPGDYQDINIPILSITGYFDGDQLGALTYYKEFMKYASKEAKKNHYLVIGPWDHGGTRKPRQEMGGLKFGKNAVLDMDRLHLKWYDWHLKGKERPPFLKNRVCYYVMGANKWKYASTLEEVSNAQQVWYLSSEKGRANDVFHSGKLTKKMPGREKPDRFEYDPLDISPAKHFNYPDAFVNYTGQTEAFARHKLIYHSPPLDQDLEVSGFITFNAYISLDVPDTDFKVMLYEIKPDGSSILLTWTVMRARYRNSLSKPELVKPGKIHLYPFDKFDFFSRKITKGSRFRLIISAINSPNWEKNYNSGGVVAEETSKDARKAVITLYHDKKHPSHLVLPVTINQ